MKILIVGGAGLIGGTTALLLREHGHDVTIAGRNPPAADGPLTDFAWVRIDYTAPDLDQTLLQGYDALVFAAGNDVRHKPQDAGDEHWQFANSEAVPRFFAAARDAGIPRAINVGSYYAQVAPHLAATNAYVRSRIESEAGVIALASPDFVTMSLNAPLIIGRLDGVSMAWFESHIRFALGELAPMPEFVPPGGTNMMSVRSLAEAIEGAILRGEAGVSYLIGDENLTYQQYFAAYFDAVGRTPPPVRDEEAPIYPDRSIYVGRGNSMFYETDPEQTRLLGYRLGDVVPTIQDMVAHYLERHPRSG